MSPGPAAVCHPRSSWVCVLDVGLSADTKAGVSSNISLTLSVSTHEDHFSCILGKVETIRDLDCIRRVFSSYRCFPGSDAKCVVTSSKGAYRELTKRGRDTSSSHFIDGLTTYFVSEPFSVWLLLDPPCMIKHQGCFKSGHH